MKYSAGSFRERKQKVMLKLTKTSLLNFTCFFNATTKYSIFDGFAGI